MGNVARISLSCHLHKARHLLLGLATIIFDVVISHFLYGNVNMWIWPTNMVHMTNIW